VSVKPAELTQFLDEVGVYQVLKGKLVAIEPEIVNRRTGTRCSILGGKPVKPTASQGFWSGRWESNPTPIHHNLLKILASFLLSASNYVQFQRI
jgi:hypothetical protein